VKTAAAHRGAVFAALVWLMSAPRPADGAEQIPADPDRIATSIEFNGGIQAKAGDRLSIGPLDLGGFIELRSEPRLHRGLLPGHSWRGQCCGLLSFPVVREMQTAISLFGGFSHESSRAATRIDGTQRDPYVMIYDASSRNKAMNGIPLGAELVMYDEVQRFVLRVSGTAYFLSRNTPELPGNRVSGSGGFSVGGLYRYSFGERIGLFASLHERFVLRGPAEASGEIFTAGAGNAAVERVSWPVINRSNTFTAATGVSVPLFQPRRVLMAYLACLIGNPYGYHDSRDSQRLLSCGLAIGGM
jgi:hypothetical protein